jgi:hypothetical protein
MHPCGVETAARHCAGNGVLLELRLRRVRRCSTEGIHVDTQDLEAGRIEPYLVGRSIAADNDELAPGLAGDQLAFLHQPLEVGDAAHWQQLREFGRTNVGSVHMKLHLS